MAPYDRPVDPEPVRLRSLKRSSKDEEDHVALMSERNGTFLMDPPTLTAESRSSSKDSGPSDLENLKGSPGRQPKHSPAKRPEDATDLEVLYDLFLACLNLFNQNQQLASLQGLTAYVGFFTLLWSTWFLTTLYDVRFLTDSVFERCCRGIHLGVLVGFVTVSPNFDPSDQDTQVFHIFSLILMTSRLCIAVEYAMIALGLRNHKPARTPLLLMVALNCVAALIYFGVSFGFISEEHDTRLFWSWFPIVILEVIATIGLSWKFPVLSFQDTYIIRRVSVLTLIIFGEGVTFGCVNITNIVGIDGHDAWTPPTIGIVTANVATIYIVFMVYFDWLRHFYLPTLAQIGWVVVHYPLHLALTLFMEGSAQFVIFWKISEFQISWLSTWTQIATEGLDTYPERILEWTQNFTRQYPTQYPQYLTALNEGFENLTAIDLPELIQRVRDSNATTAEEILAVPGYLDYYNAEMTIVYVIDNIVSSMYGNDFLEDQVEMQLGGGVLDQITPESLQSLQNLDMENLDFNEAVSNRSFTRTRAVFQYSFVCAGVVLGFMTLLSIISRSPGKWQRMEIIRTVINFAVALGLGLVALVSQSQSHYIDFVLTPWILPTLTLAWFFILVLNHLPSERPVFTAYRTRTW